MNLPDLPYILGVYAVMSLVTFVVFGYDKGQARRGGRRVPERTLHGLEMLGGWSGALLGRRHFRHKTRKREYTVVLYGIVALHVAVWVWVLVETLS